MWGIQETQQRVRRVLIYSLLHRNFARLVDLQTQLDVSLLQEHRGRAVQLRQVVGQLHQLITPLLKRENKFECSREINWFCRSFVHVSVGRRFIINSSLGLELCWFMESPRREAKFTSVTARRIHDAGTTGPRKILSLRAHKTTSTCWAHLAPLRNCLNGTMTDEKLG